MRLLWPLLAVLLIVVTSPAAAETVALTFDDLPTLSLSNDLAFSKETTTELLAGLARHHLPAIGFVNETPVEAYIADVQRGEVVTRSLLLARGRTPHWFRHPYLETGPTLEVRQVFETWLRAHDYRIAPVTMENADWMFAYPYDDAILHRDVEAASRIKGEYVAYSIAVVAWYRTAALQVLGRRPSFVFLLHASRLNADSIDAIAAVLQSEGLTAVTLDKAMQDPAYDLKDQYAGPDGDEWITRWGLALHKDLPWSSFPQPPADIAADEQRLDSSP